MQLRTGIKKTRILYINMCKRNVENKLRES